MPLHCPHLIHAYGTEHKLLVDVLGQWQLHEDPMDIGVQVEVLDHSKHLSLRGRLREVGGEACYTNLRWIKPMTDQNV